MWYSCKFYLDPASIYRAACWDWAQSLFQKKKKKLRAGSHPRSNQETQSDIAQQLQADRTWLLAWVEMSMGRHGPAWGACRGRGEIEDLCDK